MRQLEHNSFALLRELAEASRERPERAVEVDALATRLHLDPMDAYLASNFLHGKGLVRQMSPGLVSLTTKGAAIFF